MEATNGVAGSPRKWVWDGMHLCQERDVNNNVTKQFFADGEEINGTNNYYQKDHLGTVWSMTDSSGLMHAWYGYDPYGQQTQLGGEMASDAGYAGYYHHAPSGLNLAVYRAYDASQGRWLNQDPLADRASLANLSLKFWPNQEPLAVRPLWLAPQGSDGMTMGRQIPAELLAGPNLYEFVANNPIDYVDPLGLWTFQIGISINIQWGFVNFNGNVGIVVDGHGDIGTYNTYGVGGGAGADAGLGISFLGSNGNCIQDMGGPFGSASANLGNIADGGVEGFSGYGTQHQTVTGGGFSVGVGAGGDFTRDFPFELLFMVQIEFFQKFSRLSAHLLAFQAIFQHANRVFRSRNRVRHGLFCCNLPFEPEAETPHPC